MFNPIFKINSRMNPKSQYVCVLERASSNISLLIMAASLFMPALER